MHDWFGSGPAFDDSLWESVAAPLLCGGWVAEWMALTDVICRSLRRVGPIRSACITPFKKFTHTSAVPVVCTGMCMHVEEPRSSMSGGFFFNIAHSVVLHQSCRICTDVGMCTCGTYNIDKEKAGRGERKNRERR